jgi:hypothetical protein
LTPRFLAAVFALALALPAQAQFAGFVLPARFELKAKAGDKIAEVLEIGNDEPQAADFRVRTADWTLRADGGVDFRTDTLDNDSCRPWVKVERHIVRIAGKGKRRYRFEVEVPPGTPDGLCRFALLIEPAGDIAMVAPASGIQLPIQGRLGVIVYVRLGNAAPKLKLEGFELRDTGGRLTPFVIFRNEGNAHGRPEGVLSGSDPSGRGLDFTVAPLPVLPGERRAIPVWPQDDPDGKPVKITRPLRLKGTIDWEGGKQAVETTIGG